MFKIAKPLFLICETPLHAGSGGGVGTELPIQREVHTNFPKIEASSMKGALRESFESHKGYNDAEIIAAFGPLEDGSEHAGALGFTDARLLLFPVKSRKGVFAWISCPRVLSRFVEDLYICLDVNPSDAIKALAEKASNVPEYTISDLGSLATSGKVFLDEYCFSVQHDTNTMEFAKAIGALLNKSEIEEKLVVVPNDWFTDFVTNSTEIQTRIRIDDTTGTVKDGQLFTEEHLPAESILYSLTLANPDFKGLGKNETQILKIFTDGLKPVVQIGGSATLGKGLVRTIKTLLN